MFRRALAMMLFFLVLACVPAYAEGLPAVLNEKGAAAAFTAAPSALAAPEAGEWNQYAEVVSGLDAALVDSFRTKMAFKATDMEFNSYAQMSYSEKASVIVALADYNCPSFVHTFYGEGEAAADNAFIPANAAPGGDFAVFALLGGAWANLGMFALTNDANTTDPYHLVDLSCYGLGDAPAYLAWYDAPAALWRVVGVNQAYVDAVIELAF